MFFCMKRGPNSELINILYFRQIVIDVSKRNGSVEEFYNEYLKPVIFRNEEFPDVLSISKYLKRTKVSELLELSLLIESDYKYMQRIKGVCNDIAKVLDSSC